MIGLLLLQWRTFPAILDKDDISSEHERQYVIFFALKIRVLFLKNNLLCRPSILTSLLSR
jgi:hypothetical protein